MLAATGDEVFVVGFFIVWFILFFGGIAGMVLGVIALVSAARTPAEVFGPWWDNTKTVWLVGIAISYMIPFGLWVTSIYWFRKRKQGLRENGIVGRPFWAGPQKPYPPTPPPGYPMPPGPAASYPAPSANLHRPTAPPPPSGPPTTSAPT